MSDSESIDELESAALSVLASAGLVTQRRRSLAGVIVDIAAAAQNRESQTITVGLVIRNWGPRAWVANAPFAAREAQQLAASSPSSILRTLVPGSGSAPDPLLTLEGLRRVVAELSPPTVTRSAELLPAAKETVFCAMPFHEAFLDVYLLAILPAMTQLGFDVLRLDQAHSFAGINRRIWDGIGDARFVLADISGHNPNVLYEVGVAHGLGIDTFLIVDAGTQIPFDIRDGMVLVYDRQKMYRLVQDLPTKVKEALA